jgi:YidC/Oxa1 family membrane protein insertase
MDKQRFILAIILSAAILFGWSLLFPVKRPPQQNSTNANSAPAEQTAGTPATTPSETPAGGQINPAQATDGNIPAENIDQRTIKVTTPLYNVTLDNRGAVATSWIIEKNKDNQTKLSSVGGTKEKPLPLELIPQSRVTNVPREAPLRLQTVDGEKTPEGKFTDFLLDSRNYEVKDLTVGNEKIDLQSNELKIPAGLSGKIVFALNVEYGPENGKTKLEATKVLTFYADQYRTDVEVSFKQNRLSGDPNSPQINQPKFVKLLLGPSIGDQGVPEYNFYSVPPEGIAAVGENVGRHNAMAINQQSSDKQIVGGLIDWAGVGDTYFAMVAVPKQRTEGLEYRTTMVERPVTVNGQAGKQARYLITAHVPVSTDGSPTVLYVGPKDHYLLQDANANVGPAVGRSVDLEGMIDYGFMSWMSRPLAVPILWCIKYLYKLTNSYGIAIILFTIVIYSLFFPLKWRSSKAMKRAAKMAPRMKEVQEKMKGMKKTDPRLRELQMEQMRLMKEGNPLGGCLPLLIQMPFLFALYRAITISIDFRQASFLWIPDLSAAEPTSIHILPILMAGSMLVLQLITPAPSADPVQRKMMAIGMPLLMLWMLWSAPAGLLVYWLVGNLVGFGQQFVINRLTKTKDDEPPPQGKKAETRSTKKLNARVSQA